MDSNNFGIPASGAVAGGASGAGGINVDAEQLKTVVTTIHGIATTLQTAKTTASGAWESAIGSIGGSVEQALRNQFNAGEESFKSAIEAVTSFAETLGTIQTTYASIEEELLSAALGLGGGSNSAAGATATGGSNSSDFSYSMR